MKNFTQVGKKIIAVGRNFGAHATEMGYEVPKQPLIFMKPSTAYVTEGHKICTPLGCNSLHNELELGVVIGTRISKLGNDPTKAMASVAGYCLALDMTARDIQSEAKKTGSPWLIAKGFDTSCPVSEFIDKSVLKDPNNVELWLKVNGQLRQKGNTKDWIFKIPTILEYITKFVTLEPGDLVLTGTPEGVGPVKSGDRIQCGISGIVEMSFEVE